MRIVFGEANMSGIAAVIGTEISGTFSVPRDIAEGMVWERWSEHRVAHDHELHQWLKSIPEGSDSVSVPGDSAHADRLRYVIADLIACCGNITVTCNTCEADVHPDRIIIEEKDLSSEVSGMRIGLAGNLYLCPERHGLLFVMTKIF